MSKAYLSNIITYYKYVLYKKYNKKTMFYLYFVTDISKLTTMN